MKEGVVELYDVLVAELVEDVNLHSKVRELLQTWHKNNRPANKKSHLIRLKLADLGCCQPPCLFMSGLVNLKN